MKKFTVALAVMAVASVAAFAATAALAIPPVCGPFGC